jgi:acetyl esterase
MHSSTTTHAPVVLEPASQAFVEATATPPYLYELTPAEARKVLDDVQAAPIDKLDVDDRWITVPAEVGDVRVRIVRPPSAAGPLPVILYMHGGGWVLGNADTHDRLVRELAVGTGAAVVFVEYDRSPEARYPVAIEQGYATAQWIIREGAAHDLDPDRMAVAGDSVGGNMAAALALMANERGDVRFVQQSMYYPVTDAAMDTGSYAQFARGTSSPPRGWRGSGTPTCPTSTGAGSPSRHLSERATSSSPTSPRRSSSSTRPTCCVTRARPTRPACGQPGTP